MAFIAEAANNKLLRMKKEVSLSWRKNISPVKKQPVPTRKVRTSRRSNGFGMGSIKASLSNLECDLLLEIQAGNGGQYKKAGFGEAVLHKLFPILLQIRLCPV
ncbi:MAG: hypothetical protein NC341_12925 [Blautia sp.]|nr:hypothetical protein [Blautia sp.]MCM1202333.1 hypothetical protein [Bacteroides fragilis]